LTIQWIPHKETIVSAWTSKILHNGTTVTSRIESFQGILKRQLADSVGDPKDVMDRFRLLLKNRNIEHQAEIERIKTRRHHLQSIFTVYHGIATTIYSGQGSSAYEVI
jgi:hypothetical protein